MADAFEAQCGADRKTVAEKACSKCRRLLPAQMFNRANWLPSGLRSDCKDCCRETKKAYWAKQPKTPAAGRQAQQAELLGHGKRLCRVCDEIKSIDADNFGKLTGGGLDTTCRACVRKRVRQWAADNSERAKAQQRANCAKRYADKRRRTPAWLSREHRAAMVRIHAEARRITRETGVPHHVDHIVPLVGRHVSGLHVPWNLQILTASVNCRKSNKWNF